MWLLHWAFAREKVHLARLPGMGESGMFLTRGPGTRDSSERLGAAVGSSMNLGFEAPPDAYAVMSAVGAQRCAPMLRSYALMSADAAPDWTPFPVVRVEPGATGRAMHIDRSGKRHHCAFRMFAYRGDLPEIVAERRRAYSEWARGVAAVHRLVSVSDVLKVHALTSDTPKIAPWSAGS